MRTKNGAQRTAWSMPGLILLVVLLAAPAPTLALTSSGQAEQITASDETSLGKAFSTTSETLYHRSGIYVGMGLSRYLLRPDLDQRNYLNEIGVELDETGFCPVLVLGYSASERVAGELHLSAVNLGRPAPGVVLRLIQYTANTVIPLIRPRQLTPYITAGFGGLMFAIERDDESDIFDLAVVGDFGGGLIGRLSKHFHFCLDYRLSILNFAMEHRKGYESAANDDNFHYTDGSGTCHMLSLYFSYDL